MTSVNQTPSAGGSQQINLRQNEPLSIDLLKAAEVAYARAQKWEKARATVALVLSAGALVAAVVPEVVKLLAIVGLVGAVAQFILGQFGQAGAVLAAKLQERFDTYVFELPVNPEFKPLPLDEEVLEFAGQHASGRSKHDWYEDVGGLPKPYAILLCQRENLQWDWPLRRWWASRLQGIAIIWCVLGLTIALIFDWSTRDLMIRWLAPSLPALTLAANLVVVNRKLAREKQQMAIEVEEQVNVLPAVPVGEELPQEEVTRLMDLCRRWQDRLYRLRCPVEQVPQRVYDRRRSKRQHYSRVATARLRARLLEES